MEIENGIMSVDKTVVKNSNTSSLTLSSSQMLLLALFSLCLFPTMQSLVGIILWLLADHLY